MILTLEVIGEQAEDLGAGSRKVFNSIGGTIGRLPDNDWVFPDPYVSGRHALIRFLNGKFFVEDTSTNGVFINTPDNRLPRAQPHQLKTGDTIYIDAYRIHVSIEKPAAGEKQKDDPFALLKARAKEERANQTVAMGRAAAEEDRTAAMQRSNDDASVEWVGIDVHAPDARAEARRAQDKSSMDRSPMDRSPMDRSPSAAGAGARELPSAAGAGARELPSAPKRTPPAPAKAPQQPATPALRETPAPKPGAAAASASDSELMRVLMTSAGIDGVEPTPELAQTLGSVLRVAVGGLMEVLRARERMKDDMRLRGTTFKPQHNNPLKFSANVDDAFHNLLVKHNSAYLAPPDAFEDALGDVRDHQAAIIAAMRLAFESMLAHFDPNRLQEDFDRQMKKGTILGVPAKLRYWELYRDQYGELAKDGDSSFRNLFAEEFAKAYEQQLERLQAPGRNRPK